MDASFRVPVMITSELTELCVLDRACFRVGDREEERCVRMGSKRTNILVIRRILLCCSSRSAFMVVICWSVAAS